MIDAVVEPVRARFVPSYHKVRENALAAGAAGVAISGAGPTMIAVVDERRTPSIRVAQAMKEAFETGRVNCRAFSSKAARGAVIIKQE